MEPRGKMRRISILGVTFVVAKKTVVVGNPVSLYAEYF